MNSESVNTVMLTTKCSAGCVHCPFSNPSLKHLFLSSEKIEIILNQSKSELIVFSGGEPFEHPEIASILTKLSSEAGLFRIATGGFIDLSQWFDQLKNLLKIPCGFQGISFGTDVVSSRVNDFKWVSIWKNNIIFCHRHKIPYSLTFTVDPYLKFTGLNILRWNTIFDDTFPEFIYLRYSDDSIATKWIKTLSRTFSNISIIKDFSSA